jgi:hypothetical protein
MSNPTPGSTMSTAPHSSKHNPDTHTLIGETSAPALEPDAIDAVAHAAPIILPIVGGVLMFLLAFIAIFMA